MVSSRRLGKPSTPARHGLARTLSKLGVCSRSEATAWVLAGRVAMDGIVITDPEHPVTRGQQRLSLDGNPLGEGQRHYLALNKPRGLVTTTSDEQGRDTVYRCFEGAGLGWLAPVGRLDKASEGLLLFSNDPEWAARITDPERGLHKTYHVQIDQVPDAGLLARLQVGVQRDGELLSARSVALLRHGSKNAWLEIVLDEGRNRQIRRLLQAFGIRVLRLLRVAIGTVALGELPKGEWRALTPGEAASLAGGEQDGLTALREGQGCSRGDRFNFSGRPTRGRSG